MGVFEDLSEGLGSVAVGAAPLLGYGAASMIGAPYAAPLFSSLIGGLGGAMTASKEQRWQEEQNKKQKEELNNWRRYAWTSPSAGTNAPKWSPLESSVGTETGAGFLSGMKSGMPKDESLQSFFDKALAAKAAKAAKEKEDAYIDPAWIDLLNQASPENMAAVKQYGGVQPTFRGGPVGGEIARKRGGGV